MTVSTRKSLTERPAARFCLGPETPAQRQDEARRAYCVAGWSATQVAQRLGYTPGACRVLCPQFRPDPARRAACFPPRLPGPRAAPQRARGRAGVVALRNKNLSVYDSQRELASAGHTSSSHSLTLLLHEEGCARLPRRRDDARPATVHPVTAASADVRCLSLAPRTCRTRVAGRCCFVPLLRNLDPSAVARAAGLPGSAMIPAAAVLRTLLALKLLGTERNSQVMSLVDDEGSAWFAGLNVVPKRLYLAACSSRIDDRRTQRWLAAWSARWPQAGWTRGTSRDLDCHAGPANTAAEPLEKHGISRRSRRQQGMRTFLARAATQRVLCYARAGISKADQPGEILRFVDFWQQQTGAPPAELVFDSRLTTYAHLHQLQQRHIHFITLRRRSRKMLGAIFSRPASAWQRITLPSLSRLYRTPKVLDERLRLKGYADELR